VVGECFAASLAYLKGWRPIPGRLDPILHAFIDLFRKIDKLDQIRVPNQRGEILLEHCRAHDSSEPPFLPGRPGIVQIKLNTTQLLEKRGYAPPLDMRSKGDRSVASTATRSGALRSPVCFRNFPLIPNP